MKAYIETNLANRFIRSFKSPTSIPILFDKKSDRFFWLCINYKGLYNLIIKKQYSLPLVRVLLDRLGKARQVIQLDLMSIYYLIRICKKDKYKIVFQTWYGYFEYQLILFELTNVPASFQRYINQLFNEKPDIFVIVNLDNIFIYTNDKRDGHLPLYGRF